jgi:hypothetical protein
MKKTLIYIIVGWIVGITSMIIGLRMYANDPLVLEETRDAIPGIGQAIGLALEGSAIIWLFGLSLGFIIHIIIWLIENHNLKKKK